MSILEKLSTPRGRWDSANNVFDVDDPHTLTQAVGYLKYALRAHGPIYARSQTGTYDSLRASLFLGVTSVSRARTRESEFNRFLNGVSSAFMANTPDAAKGALLQHYGIRSPWLDLVDNAWVALWFACHRAVVTGTNQNYLHFERLPSSSSEFVYVLLLQADNVVQSAPGHWRGTSYQIIDLRVASPSTYLRPHAQHGLLIRSTRDISRIDATLADVDLLPAVVGTLRAPE
jgi:hypothetical protein